MNWSSKKGEMFVCGDERPPGGEADNSTPASASNATRADPRRAGRSRIQLRTTITCQTHSLEGRVRVRGLELGG